MFKKVDNACNIFINIMLNKTMHAIVKKYLTEFKDLCFCLEHEETRGKTSKTTLRTDQS